jgi:segregation and condensation protein A
MTEQGFEEDTATAEPPGSQLLLDLDGFEGPIDVLLQLAREQKVDVTKISILALADQYLAFIQRARHLRLEIAADYLVMAAWLAYLKSRLLIPAPESDEEPSGAEMAAALKFQLQRLQAMQESGKRLLARPRLGSEMFARGEVEPFRIVARPIIEATLFDLLSAYGRLGNRGKISSLRIAPPEVYAVEDALQRLRGLIGDTPSWRALAAFLPAALGDGVLRRSALASTFAASLELCREGQLEIRQDGMFGPIFLRGRQSAT